MMQPGPKNLITDVPGLLVGNAQDEKIKTGVTVLTGDKPLVTSYCVMGGAPGTRETDLLAPDKTIKGVDALVLSGGSAFGLEGYFRISYATSMQSLKKAMKRIKSFCETLNK